jgi:hypothetical protein
MYRTIKTLAPTAMVRLTLARWVSASTYIEEAASGMIFTQRWECATSPMKAQQARGCTPRCIPAVNLRNI